MQLLISLMVMGLSLLFFIYILFDFKTYFGLCKALSISKMALELDDVTDDVVVEQETLILSVKILSDSDASTKVAETQFCP